MECRNVESPAGSGGGCFTGAEKENAKQWTYYMEAFKRTVDGLYEICRRERSVIACKEALLYLTNSTRDFESLIESINVEDEWEADTKPHAVAWEIRKTVSPPVDSSFIKETDALINALKISPCVFAANVNVGCSKAPANEGAEDKENLNKMQLSALAKGDLSADDGWRLVTRNKRRKSVGGCSTNSSSREVSDVIPSHVPAKRSTMNVYERLTNGVLRPPNPFPRPPVLSAPSLNGARLTCPRSAMDLPQTKASMAKMAYSRQLLWQKHQPSLAEKFEKRRRRELMCTRKTGSVPGVSSLNFADPAAVARSAHAFKHRQKLQQMQNAERAAALTNVSNAPKNFESIEEVAAENDERENTRPCPEEFIPLSTRSDSLVSYPSLPEGMDADDAWRAMTEEEESLVHEEQSLKKEIEEEESLSIDDELERQVAAEAAALEQLELEKEEQTRKEENSRPPVTLEEFTKILKKEMEEYASVSWSEMCDREIGHYRKPGDFAQIHDKFSSPSRKQRNQENITKRVEERQQHAEELRQRIQEEKTRRLRELSNKVEEVRRKQMELCERKKEHLQKRMEKAEENRQKIVEEIVKKARDDDVKVMEISFIKKLETDNMRYDLKARNQEWESRVNSMAAERAKRNDEKAAKEAAAEERRRVAVMERNERLREKVDKRMARQAELESQREQIERDKANAAKEKRQCVERAAEKKAAEAAELKKKIELKQEETRRRHEESLTQVKQRAVELSSSRASENVANLADFSQIPSESGYSSCADSDSNGAFIKKCTLCDQTLESEFALMAHVLGDEHLQKKKVSLANLTYENLKEELESFLTLEREPTEIAPRTKSPKNEVSKSSSAALRKRRARLRQKFSAKSKETSSVVAKIIGDSLNSKTSATKTSVDKAMREVIRVVKSAMGESFVAECCEGTTKESYQGKACHSADVPVIERAIGDVQRTLLTGAKLDIKQQNVLITALWSAGFCDALLALLCFSSNGDAVVPCRTQSKAAQLLETIINLNKRFLCQVFFTNRLLVLIDTVCVHLKHHLCQFSGSGTPCEASNGTMNCASFASFIAKVFSSYSVAIIEDAAVADIDRDGERIKMSFSLMAHCGLGDFLCASLQQFASSADNSKQRDNCLLTARYISQIFFIADKLLAVTENVSTGSRELSVDSQESPQTEKVKSIFAVALPRVVALLAEIVFGRLSQSSNIGKTPNSPSSAEERRVDGSDGASSLGALFIHSWSLLIKREPNEAKAFMKDSAFLLRVVHIIVHFLSLFRELESSKVSGIPSANASEEWSPMRCTLRDLILCVGHFASIGVKAQVLCVFGWDRSLVSQLCALPLPHFTNPALASFLMPTLCAICFRNKAAVELVKQSMSLHMLSDYLKSAKEVPVVEPNRFPSKFWDEAVEYFENC